MTKTRKLTPYRRSLAGALLAAREAVMAPIRPMLREAGVTEQQWRVLRVLNDDGPVDLSTLASYALILPPSLTRILKDLIHRGMAVRVVDPEDGRRSVVAISPQGTALVQSTADGTFALLDSYAARFGAERLQTLIQDLGDLAAAIETPAVECAGTPE